MIAFDTNVLARFLLRDDTGQSGLAAKALDACTQDSPAFVSREVAVELFWVLERAAAIPRRDVALLMQGLLVATRIAFETPDRIAAALQGTLISNLDFADQLIALAASANEAAVTLTFDKRAAKIPGMRLLG